MIHILLLLLKIIGITLLSILGLLVLIILVILFVPVRYSLKVEAEQSVKVNARVSWLLHLLHAEAVYDETFGVVIRVFGIPVKRMPAPEEKETRKKKKRKQKKHVPQEKAAHVPEGSDNGTEAESGVKTEAVCPDPNKTAGLSETVPPDGQRAEEVGVAKPDEDIYLEKDEADAPQMDSDTDEVDEKKEKLSFFQKIAKFFRNIAHFFRAVRTFFSKILYTIRNICDKIEKIKELAGYYAEVLRSEEGQKTFALMKRELGRLFRHIAPTKLKGSITIGMDDPAVTGQILAIVSMFYPIYGNNVSITPDFDEKCLRGNLYLKGRIRVITLIRIAWRVYFNKDMKKFLHMLKREENEA